MIQRICIGPTPACFYERSNSTRGSALKQSDESNDFHTFHCARIQDCNPLAANFNQTIRLQLGYGVRHSLSINAELIGHLLMGVADNLVIFVGELCKQRCDSGCDGLECGLLMSPLSVNQSRSNLAKNVQRNHW